MRFTISKQDLLTAINRVIKATASRPSVPYLSGVLITAKDSSVTLFASDLETSIQTEVDCKVEVDGVAAVAGKILSNIVSALPETMINFSTNGEFLTIEAGQSKFEIRTINVADFSDFPEIEKDQEIVIPADNFSSMAKKVAKAVSRDESRVILTGVLVTVKDNIITMVSTDSFRLALIGQELKKASDEVFEVLVPGKVIEETARMVKGSDNLTIVSSANQILFSFDKTKMVTRRLEGKFPNYKQLLPDSYTTKAIIDHSELLESVRRVSLLALNNAAVNVEISAENQTLSLNAKTQELGTAKESLLVKAEGEDNNIAINYSYFIDGLTSINSGTVYLEIQDPLRPGILRAPEENFTYLVMPVRAN
ncbi:MAG: DNA polymerase III subunit beta [Coriobacteriia bacterium]|nr:DNA polymerase III subunit beta [Coriobacteriia bacterium]